MVKEKRMRKDSPRVKNNYKKNIQLRYMKEQNREEGEEEER